MGANESQKASDAPTRFKVGDRVRVRKMPNMFYTRTQSYVRGVIGTIAACTYKEPVREHVELSEAFVILREAA